MLLCAAVTSAGAEIDLAHLVSNNLHASIDSMAEVMPVATGGTGTTTLRVNSTNDDGKNGCNLTGSTTLTISLSSSNTSVATVSPSSVTFDSCGATRTVTVTAQGSSASTRSATITAAVVSNNSGGSFDLAPVSFRVDVAPAPVTNTPPSVVVAGVTTGSSYPEGSVPAATCQVTDAEDGNSTFPATLSAISGPDASGGVGSQTASCSYTDQGGLGPAVSSAVYSIVDGTAPGVSVVLNPASPDGDNGWYRSNVGIDWTVTEGDSTSTLQTTGCTDLTISADQQLIDYSCTATSGGGTTGPVTRAVKRDATKPVVTCHAGPSGWQAVNVTLDCTASDATSGLNSPTDAGFTLATTVADNADDASAATGSKTVKDKAGNEDTIGPRTFQVDRKAPVVSCDRESDSSTWFKTNQTVHCTATDGDGSGLDSSGDASFDLTTTVAPGDEDSSASTPGRTVEDAVGNTTTVTARTFKVDRKGPAIVCTPDDQTVWYGANKSVACTASDSGSDLADSADAAFTLAATDMADAAEGSDATGSHVVTDAAGNSATAGPYTFKIDRKAPSIVCTPSGQGDWHNDDQTVPCTSGDGGSGVLPAADESFTLTAQLADGEEDSSVPTNTKTVSDEVGNEATSSSYDFKIDKKAPSVSCPRGSDTTTWYGENQDVACTSTDGGSGVPASADQAFTLSTQVAPGEETEGAPTSERDVADAVGNSKHAGPYTFNVDIKAPTIDCSPSGLTAWHAGDQSVSCTSSDGGSGVAPSADESFSLTANLADGQENAAVSTGTKTVKDAVNNAATSPAYSFKIDKKGPVAGCTPGDQTIWYAADQSVPCSASDGGSGVSPTTFSLSTNVANGSDDENASTGDRTLQDGVGNPSNTVGPYEFKVDKKKPVVTCTPDDQTVWYAANKTVHCTATDGTGSGLASAGDASFDLAATTVSAGEERNNATTGSKVVKDQVDNAAAAVGPFTFKVDIKGPAVAVTCPANVTVGIPVTVSYTATDGGVGPATQNGTISYTATTIGSQTVTVPAGAKQDALGNQSIAGSCQTNGLFDFAGFFQPIDNGAVLNKAKAGSAIPVKFSLRGDKGLAIFAAGYPTAKKVTCDAAAPTDLMEELATGTTSGLKYDATADQYNYTWKTSTAYANTCQQLVVKFVDGSTKTALFQFVK
jgi:hypothetical protein